MRKVAAFTLIVLAAPLLAAAPGSPAPSAADTVRTRIAGFRELGAAFKNVSDGMRGDPQIILIQQSARQIKNSSAAINNWFPAGSGPQRGIKTSAKPEIWTRSAQFAAAKANFARQADAFQAAAASGNASTIRGAFRQLGGTCKGCHDQFRVPPEN
ncbi:MAG: cytochrome c [Novosphingobium sp.]